MSAESAATARAKDNLKTLNNSFAFAGVGAVVVGLTRLNELPTVHLGLFVTFLLLFRLKMWLDDGRFFAGTNRTERPGMFAFGLVIGILSWVLYIVAGYSVAEPRVTYLLVALGLVLSTIWVVAAAVHDASRWDIHPAMFVFNVLYIFSLIVLLDMIELPFPERGWLPGLLIVLLVADAKATGSFDEVTT